MLLSKSQKRLLDILREFGALRETQAVKLLKMKDAKVNIDSVFRQMVCGGLIKRENGYVLSSDGGLENSSIEAIDIMLLMETEQISMFQKGKQPFSLTFFKQRQDKLWRYDVCHIKSGTEDVMNATLENINPKYRIIVFVVENAEQQKYLKTACEHCFVQQENGNYRFYK